MSSIAEITVGPEDFGGCGEPHRRPLDESGWPVQPWALTCADCEPHLRGDQLWSASVHEIPPTHDEVKQQERFAIEGPKQQAALLTAALARLSGLGNQIPPSLQRQMEGLKAHIPLPGQLVCRECSAASPAGQRFCGACGAGLSVPVAAAAIKSGPAA
jgi:hypothetical protein